jgi:ectoine hydroxylase-related dioxygenase (phytanoyl-CoA dioxygenase family)
LEQVLGPNILLKSTRLFYKHGKTAAYVGWHQDGITERLEDARAPAIWLGLTEATVENGCLRVVPRSHRLGFLQHDTRPDQESLASFDTTAKLENWFRTHGGDLSGKIARVPIDLDSPFDIVMRPGEMSFHQPLILHGSNSNLSSEPRIGLSASYSAPEFYNSPKAVAWVRSDGRTQHYRFEVIDKPPTATFEEAVAAYCISNRQILFAEI